MRLSISRSVTFLFTGIISMCLLTRTPVRAQEILGAITGIVKDPSGAVVARVKVSARNAATNEEVTHETDSNGSYSILNLPVGVYAVSFSKTEFQTENHTQIVVMGNRTTTVEGALQVGAATSTIEVTATPLMNQVDMTNGYVVDELTIQNTPLGTGSFTQLAIMAPGVHADFLGGSGANSGLGNQAIFAN